MVERPRLDTKEEKVAYLLREVPATRYNYKLLLLMYWQVFDKVNIPEDVLNDILKNGTEPESIGRLRRKNLGTDLTYNEVINKIKEALKEDTDNERSNQSKDKT